MSSLQANSISSHLSRYPDRSSALALGEGLLKGFKLMYLGPRLPVNSKHFTCAHQHPHVFTPVTYTSFETVIQIIIEVDTGVVIAKCDIKSAFVSSGFIRVILNCRAFDLLGTTILTSVYHLVVPFPAEYLRRSSLSQSSWFGISQAYTQFIII